MSGGGLRERWAHWALVKRIGSLGLNWRRILHEVRVWRHVGGSLRIVTVGRNWRLGRGRPYVGGSVVLVGTMLARRHSSPGTPTILMERHGFKSRRANNKRVSFLLVKKIQKS